MPRSEHIELSGDRFDAALDSLLVSDARIEVLCGGFEWAEGPVWVPESGNKFGGYVLFSDIPQHAEDSRREIDFCGVYRLQKGGTVTVQCRDISRPNGIAFSPDEKTLYVANSDGQDPVWRAFPVQDDGNPGTPTVFFDSSTDSRIPKGGGDGLKVDADGNVFATGPGGVLILSPQGKLPGRIVTGENIANVGWGNDGRVLYLTSDMYLCRIRTETKGAGF